MSHLSLRTAFVFGFALWAAPALAETGPTSDEAGVSDASIDAADALPDDAADAAEAPAPADEAGPAGAPSASPSTGILRSRPPAACAWSPASGATGAELFALSLAVPALALLRRRRARQPA